MRGQQILLSGTLWVPYLKCFVWEVVKCKVGTPNVDDHLWWFLTYMRKCSQLLNVHIWKVENTTRIWDGWGGPARTLVPWRQGFRRPTKERVYGLVRPNPYETWAACLVLVMILCECLYNDRCLDFQWCRTILFLKKKLIVFYRCKMSCLSTTQEGGGWLFIPRTNWRDCKKRYYLRH